jgi:predicted DNA-binding transcriptional regulator AlpA
MSELVSRLIPRKIVKQRLGDVSDMTIWRLEQDRESGFPLPVVINGRCYYYEDEFSSWLTNRPRKANRREAAIAA